MAFSLALTQAVYIYILVRDKTSLGTYELVPASFIAETLEIPKPSVVKILGVMASAGLLETGSGIKGGVRPASGAETRTFLDLFLAVEGRKPMFRNDHVFRAPGVRPEQARQSVAELFKSLEQQFHASLSAISLATLIPADIPPD